jgi:hypothetical protein
VTQRALTPDEAERYTQRQRISRDTACVTSPLRLGDEQPNQDRKRDDWQPGEQEYVG